MGNRQYKADILVVDDKPVNLRIMTTMLSEQGCKVRSVLSGEMALAAARSAPPDLILLDIKMPGMSGYDVCRELKADPQLQHIPVIVVTALNEATDISQAYKVGAAGYINKPFLLSEVLDKIKQHISI